MNFRVAITDDKRYLAAARLPSTVLLSFTGKEAGSPGWTISINGVLGICKAEFVDDSGELTYQYTKRLPFENRNETVEALKNLLQRFEAFTIYDFAAMGFTLLWSKEVSLDDDED